MTVPFYTCVFIYTHVCMCVCARCNMPPLGTVGLSWGGSVWPLSLRKTHLRFAFDFVYIVLHVTSLHIIHKPVCLSSLSSNWLKDIWVVTNIFFFFTINIHMVLCKHKFLLFLGKYLGVGLLGYLLSIYMFGFIKPYMFSKMDAPFWIYVSPVVLHCE